MNPTTIPNILLNCQTVWSPRSEVMIAANIGTVEISNPANPESIFFCAVEIKIQGPIISRRA